MSRTEAAASILTIALCVWIGAGAGAASDRSNPTATNDAAGDDRSAAHADWLEQRESGREEVDALQGKPPPPLQVTDWLNSRPLRLEDLKGRVVMLDFWATWCFPCIVAIPHHNELHAKYRDEGLIIIGVCHSRGAEKMAQLAREQGIAYPIAADVEHRTHGAYRIDTYPDYYLIDRAGNLRFADLKNEKLEEAIEALLAEPAPDQQSE